MAKNIAPAPAAGSAPVGSGVVVNASGAPSKSTTLRPKAHNKDVNPANQPVVPARAYAPKERSGASFGIQVGFEAHQAPEAGFLQSQGRIMPSAVNRSAPNFRAGMADYN